MNVPPVRAIVTHETQARPTPALSNALRSNLHKVTLQTAFLPLPYLQTACLPEGPLAPSLPSQNYYRSKPS